MTSTNLTDVGVADRRQTIVPVANNVPYLAVVALMSILAVGFVLGISFLRPTADNGQLITTILGFIATTTASVLAFMKAQETHLSVNSRLDEFMSNARLASHALGVTEGRAQGRTAADARTDALAAGTDLSATAPAVKVEVVNTPLTVTTEPKE